RLANNRIDAQSGFAGGSVANNQLALAAPNRDHGINRHDSRLDGLTDGFAADNARSDFLDRVSHVALDVAFAIDRAAQAIHDSAEEALTHGHLQQLPRGSNFVPFLNLGVIA